MKSSPKTDCTALALSPNNLSIIGEQASPLAIDLTTYLLSRAYLHGYGEVSSLNFPLLVALGCSLIFR